MMIKAKNIQKSYKSKQTKVDVLRDISFSINKGEVVGLLGSNGAGKTTLIKILCNLIEADEGEIFIHGTPLIHSNKKAIKYVSSVLEGNRNLYWRLTVKENVEYFLGIRGVGRKKIENKLLPLLRRFNLYEKKDELVKNLSRGMQQKVAIIVALMLDTEVLILDEPTLGLDVQSNIEIIDFLLEIAKSESKTILISSHDMKLIEKLCSRVLIINDGEIVTDESVNVLLRLFDVKSYIFRFNEPLSEQQRLNLANLFDNSSLVETSEGEVFKITLTRNEDFYEVMEVFKKFHILVDSIERDQIDFEKVFLDIIRRTKDHAVI